MEQFSVFSDEFDAEVPTTTLFDDIDPLTTFDPLFEDSISEYESRYEDKLKSPSLLDSSLLTEGNQQQQRKQKQSSSNSCHVEFSEDEQQQRHQKQQQQYLPSPISLSAGDMETSNKELEDDDDIIDTVSLGSNASEDDLSSSTTQDGPRPHPSSSLTESIIAQKMSRLSMKERETIYYDIHGVSDVIDEKNEIGLIDPKLNEMELELQKILLRPDLIARIRSNVFCEDGGESKNTTTSTSVRKTGYEMALDCNPSYVRDKDLRLRFLRAERFQAHLAAERYIYYYENKLALFGADKLGRDITQDDLGDEALDALYSGQGQILPQRDSAGRLVWVWIAGEQLQQYSVTSVLRRMFYSTMTASDDIETQRKGFVFVAYGLNRKSKLKGSAGAQKVRNLMSFARATPIRCCGIHGCYNNYSMMPLMSITQLSLNICWQLRFRAHYGSHSECMYKLQTFGIPVENFPIDADGKLNTDRHRQFFERRRAQEREWAQERIDRERNQQRQQEGQEPSGNTSSPSSSTTLSHIDSAKKDDENSNKKCQRISVPSRYDVLLGRGKGYFNHVGNVRYRSLIDDLRDKYESVPRLVKQKMIKEIIETVHESGGRFLKDDGGVWIEIDDASTCRKIGQSFRALRVSNGNEHNKNHLLAGGGNDANGSSNGDGPLRKLNINYFSFVDGNFGNAVAPISKRIRRD